MKRNIIGSTMQRWLDVRSIADFINALKSLNFDGFICVDWNDEITSADIVLTHFISYMSRITDSGKNTRPVYYNRSKTGTHPWKKFDVVDLTFSQVLDKMVEYYPDQYAFKYTTLDYTRTYSQFRDDVDNTAAALISLGVKAGHHVAIWTTNIPQWFITFWATVKIGAVLVTVNTAYKIHEIEYLLRQSDTHTLVMTEGAKAENVTVTIPEGTGINDYIKNVNGEDVTVKGIATILEEAGVCTKSDFIYALNEVEFEDSRLLENCNVGKTYYALEGYLFPETYNFYSYDSAECAKMVVERMIAQTDKRITDEMYNRAEELGYTMNEILTMASVIQMEAGQNFKEMKNVAAVFYNRLNDKNEGTLGSSPTCYYGESFKNDDGRYNTYDVKGLPPGPLCSPGLEAIKAALYLPR